MARYTESVCRLCRREGAKLFLKGSRCYTQEVRLRAPSVAARPARRPPPQGRRVRPPAAREAEGPPRLRRPRAPVPELLRRRREPPRRDRREPPPARSSCASTTSSTGWASPRSRAQARQLVGHGHFAVNGVPDEHPVLPAQARRPDRGPRDAPQPASRSSSPRRRSARTRRRSGCRSMPPSCRGPSPTCPAATRCRSTSTSSSWSSTTRGKPRS